MSGIKTLRSYALSHDNDSSVGGTDDDCEGFLRSRTVIAMMIVVIDHANYGILTCV